MGWHQVLLCSLVGSCRREFVYELVYICAVFCESTYDYRFCALKFTWSLRIRTPFAGAPTPARHKKNQQKNHVRRGLVSLYSPSLVAWHWHHTAHSNAPRCRLWLLSHTKKDPLSTTTLWAATAAPNAPDISALWSSTTWKEIPAGSKVENRNQTSQAADLCIGEQT